MNQLFRAAMYRMTKTTGVRLAVMVTWMAAVLYFMLAYMISTGSLAAEQAGSVTGLGDAMIIWLFGSLLTGLVIGSDFENRTVHGAISFGRMRILINYILVYTIFIGLLVLPYLLCSVISIVMGSRMAGAEPAAVSVFLDNVLRCPEKVPFGKLVLSYFAYTVNLISQLSICLPVALKLKKPIAVTAFGFFFGMLTAVLTTLVSKIQILDTLYRFTPYGYGIADFGLDAAYADMLRAVAAGLLFMALMGLVSWRIFRRAEIK